MSQHAEGINLSSELPGQCSYLSSTFHTRYSIILLPTAWMSGGKKGVKDLYERAAEMYKEILKQLQPQMLSEVVRPEMYSFEKRADEHLVGKLGTA
jgi:hypothetical protein